ncbi:MAG: hypothetical protein FJZ96_05225, partial [Chloroflexi bacterium]|nr:hypothetical protein [Chloroflexota bacterium]
VLRLKVLDMRQQGRATRGVKVMEVKAGDRVASVARIATEELKKVGVPNGESKGEEPQPQLF